MRKLIHSATIGSWVQRAPLIVGTHSMTHSSEQVSLFGLLCVCVYMCVFA